MRLSHTWLACSVQCALVKWFRGWRGIGERLIGSWHGALVRVII